jgi:hypothetical protein
MTNPFWTVEIKNGKPSKIPTALGEKLIIILLFGVIAGLILLIIYIGSTLYASANNYPTSWWERNVAWGWWNRTSGFTSYFSPGKDDKLTAKKASNLAQNEIKQNKLKEGVDKANAPKMQAIDAKNLAQMQIINNKLKAVANQKK